MFKNKNILKLIGSTILAQGMTIGLMPIMTRIYTPEDFGIYGIFLAIISILALISTARYESAILLPKSDKDAFNLLLLVVIFVAIFCVLITVLIIIFNNEISSLIDNEKITSIIYFIPLLIFATAINQTIYIWLNRNLKYNEMSINKFNIASSTIFTQVLFGKLQPLINYGLLFGHSIGQLMGLIYNVMLLNKIVKKINISKKKLTKLLYKYQNFPKYVLPANILNQISRQLPNILINIIYNSKYAGYYILVQKVLGAPIYIIGAAYGDIFRQEASNNLINNNNCTEILKKTLIQLFIIGIIPFSLLILYAPNIFGYIFGYEWIIAGEYASILAPMFFFQFIANPISTIYIIANRQKEDFSIQIVMLVLLCFLFYLNLEIVTFLKLFSLFFSIIYLFIIYRSFKFARGV